MDCKKLMQEERLRVLRELKGGSSVASPELAKSSITLAPLELATSNTQLLLPESFDLDRYRIGAELSLDSMFYIPNVLSSENEASLAKCITLEGEHDSQRWTQLRTRRLQCWGKFPPSSTESCARNDLIPKWLSNVIDQITTTLPMIFDASNPPNNVLINQYQPSEGILHHTDGPLYEDKVLIISLQSDCLMTFRRNLTSDQIGKEYGGDVFSVLLQRNSLLYFTKDLYTQYMHGIAAEDVHTIGQGRDASGAGVSCSCLNSMACSVAEGDAVERGLRTSLTFRILRNVA